MAERDPALLKLYGLATRVLAPALPYYLRKRLAKGKEDPGRWREKLGEPSAMRPEGSLVWLHAVGLGEVLALRGLVERLSVRRPGLSFLVTSMARSSSEVFARNCPDRTVHQFLPLDAPRFATRFLDHWRPDLSIWAEQDLWPGIVAETHRRGIPLALVNARMGSRAFESRKKAAGLFSALYGRFGLISAQDNETARHLERLGARDITVDGSLKPFAPPLSDDPTARAAFASAVRGRALWCAASTHPDDEDQILEAAVLRGKKDPSSLLVLAPRDPRRGDDLRRDAEARGLAVAQRTRAETPEAATAVYLADTFGEMGLWYRLCPVSLVAGSFGAVGGHNPWEPARLGSAVLHGPNISNFREDYAAFHAAGAAREVSGARDLAEALASDLDGMREKAGALLTEGDARLDALADRLLALLGESAA